MRPSFRRQSLGHSCWSGLLLAACCVLPPLVCRQGRCGSSKRPDGSEMIPRRFNLDGYAEPRSLEAPGDCLMHRATRQTCVSPGVVTAGLAQEGTGIVAHSGITGAVDSPPQFFSYAHAGKQERTKNIPKFYRGGGAGQQVWPRDSVEGGRHQATFYLHLRPTRQAKPIGQRWRRRCGASGTETEQIIFRHINAKQCLAPAAGKPIFGSENHETTAPLDWHRNSSASSAKRQPISSRWPGKLG